MAALAKSLLLAGGLAVASARASGGDPQAIADYLNGYYYAYDSKDPTTPTGVTMSVPANQTNFYGNLFCASYDNPYGRTGCDRGMCDCRLSAALYNHLMLLTEGGTVMDILKRHVAVVFNQTLVEEYLARCFYVWDGATGFKLNIGCGTGIGGDCTSPNSAFKNICPSTGKTCTSKDPESVSNLCQQFGGQFPPPPQHSGHYQCAYPGPAIDYHEQEGWAPTESRPILRSMVDFRVANQAGTDSGESPPTLKSKMWNEVVMDIRLLMPQIEADPALVVPAIVYWKDDFSSKMFAKQMRDNFCQVNKLDKKIPLLALDWRASVAKKEPVFLALPEDDEASELTVTV